MALAFLRRFPELAGVQKAGAARLREFYAKHNVRSEERIAERLALLGRARALSEDRAVIGPARLELSRLLDLLKVEARHIALMEERIEEVFASHPKAQVFASLPGAGPTLAPRLLTAFGDVEARYPNAPALQKYAGLAPVREKSQNKVWVHWPMGRTEVRAPKLRGMGRPDGVALRLGQGVLPQTKSRRQRPSRHPARPRLQMASHTLALLEGRRALRRDPLSRRPRQT
jgi:hypothetical protein